MAITTWNQFYAEIEPLLLKHWGAGANIHQAGLEAAMNTFGANNTPANMLNFMKAWIPAHPAAQKFKTDLARFKSAWKDYSPSDEAYDTEKWTDAKIDEEFRRRYALDPNKPVENIAQDFSAFITRPEQQEGFEEDGTPFDTTELDKLFDDMGLDKEENRALYDHLKQMLEDEEINTYQAEQMMRADPTYLEQELNRQRDEWLEKLPGFQQEELALIDKEGERARAETEDVFREDIAPTIRREVGLLGGRGREFQAHALAGAAGELEEQRQNYMSKLKLDVEFADVERRRMAEAGRFEDIKGVSAFGGEQGLKSYQNVLTQRMKTLDTMQNLSLQKSQTLSIRASERYQREYTKEIKRLERIETDRTKRASKKAGKMGMFANVFSGIVMAGLGAATGGASLPFTLAAATAGGAAGYGTSYLQNQGIGGFTPPNSFYMGRAFAPTPKA